MTAKLVALMLSAWYLLPLGAQEKEDDRRAKGIFGGVSLEGSTLRSDDGANENLYGKKLEAKDIVRAGQVRVPADGKQLINLLQVTSPKHTL
jgi:lipid-binding SYLF domain-containing protein